MLRKILIPIFAFIGLLSTIFFLLNYSKHESAAKKFRNHCEEIKPGMTLQELKIAMGDDYNSEYRSEIFIESGNSPSNRYYLRYPSAYGASMQTDIYFDPLTKIVTDVHCGD